MILNLSTDMRKRIDLTGQRYGRLIVLKEVEKEGRGRHFLCRCDCGNEKVIRMNQLRTGKTKSCGCYNKERVTEANLKDLTGHRFGKLTVVERSPKKHATENKAIWKCICDCGEKIEALSTYLTSGDTSSCGCHRKEVGKKLQKYNHSNLIKDGVFTPLLKSKMRSNNKTGVKGVMKLAKNGKYRAYIGIKGKKIYLGEFTTLEQAKVARKLAEEKYHHPYLEEKNDEEKSPPLM